MIDRCKASFTRLNGGVSTFAYVEGDPISGVDPAGLATAILVGGSIPSNPFGHVALAFTGQGVYSPGTNTPFGSSTSAYLQSQASYRDTAVIILNTTPTQEAKMLASMQSTAGRPLPNPFKDLKGAASDTCATRVNDALAAGGINIPLRGLLNPLPISSGLAGGWGDSSFFVPRGGSVPAIMGGF